VNDARPETLQAEDKTIQRKQLNKYANNEEKHT
jgi:hypothetical protein